MHKNQQAYLKANPARPSLVNCKSLYLKKLAPTEIKLAAIDIEETIDNYSKEISFAFQMNISKYPFCKWVKTILEEHALIAADAGKILEFGFTKVYYQM